MVEVNTKLHAVLRSFNSGSVIELVNRLALAKSLESIIVVVDEKRDTIDTPKLLREASCPLPIKVIQLTEYGWSKALNVAIQSLPITDVSNDEFVMPISNEVLIEPDQIQMLLRVASQEDASCGYALFEGRYELSYSVPRNTCAIWKRSLFSTICYFNERLDNEGGMEDYDMVLCAFNRFHLLPFPSEERIKLVVRDPEHFAQKIAVEERAIKAIEIRYPKD
ncbi:unnamed protein product, partial [marine sediment metagenome]